MSKRNKSNYSVGHGKTPSSTRYKPGQSGNKKGRPKRSNNLASALQKELAKQIDVTEDGSRKKITKEQAIIKQLVNKAASGDARLMSLLLKEIGADNADESSGSSHEVLGGAPDELVIENIVKRIRQSDPTPPAATDGDSDKPANTPNEPESKL